MPTEMELTLEQTQQGVSYEVSVPKSKSSCLNDNSSAIFESMSLRTVIIWKYWHYKDNYQGMEQISKKRTKNEAKTTKPDTEWKSVEKTKSRQSPSLKKSTKVNPDKSKVKK
ncbi:hypothetical protein Tco_1241499 [Tanacetum coccineum]